MFGPGLAAARHVKHETEQFPADVLDRRVAGRDAAGVDVDQIVPALLSSLRVDTLMTGTAASP